MYAIFYVMISYLTLIFENFEHKFPNKGIFALRSIIFLIFLKFWLYPISKVLISNLICFRKLWAQISKFEHLGQNVLTFYFNEIFPVRYFEGADFKPDIRFLWFLAA